MCFCFSVQKQMKRKRCTHPCSLLLPDTRVINDYWIRTKRLQTNVIEDIEIAIQDSAPIFAIPGEYPFFPDPTRSSFTIDLYGSAGGGGFPPTPPVPSPGNLSYNIAGGGGGGILVRVQIAITSSPEHSYLITVGKGGTGASFDTKGNGTPGEQGAMTLLEDIVNGVTVRSLQLLGGGGGGGVPPSFPGGSPGTLILTGTWTEPILTQEAEAGFAGASNQSNLLIGRGGATPSFGVPFLGAQSAKPNFTGNPFEGKTTPAQSGADPAGGGGAGMTQQYESGSLSAAQAGGDGGDGRVLIVYE